MPKITKTKSGKHQYRSKSGRKVGSAKKTRAAARRVGRKS